MPAAKKTETETETEKTKALTESSAALPDNIDFGTDAGGGMEEADRDSFAIPFLRVLQKGSPQCDEANPAEYMAEARAGMLYNTVTRELYREVVVLPCAYQRRFIHWGARGSGDSGFKGEYLPSQAREMEIEGRVTLHENRLLFPGPNGELSVKDCAQLSDSRNHYVVVLREDGSATTALITLSSTQIKKSKQLMSLLNELKIKAGDKLVTPPTWLSRIKVTTVPESNDEGSWSGIKFEHDGYVQDSDLYAMGKSFRNAVAEGEGKVNYDDLVDEKVVDDDSI